MFAVFFKSRVIKNTKEVKITMPEKLLFTISEVSRLVKIKPHVLRYWESEFSNLRPEKSESGQRKYRQKDLDLILKIKELLYNKKYTILGAKEVLKKEPIELEVKSSYLDLSWIRKELNDLLQILEQ
ncbi:MerR family transcriptional regulator [bacterium]|nr:MerR family transcriptional regulator [bacterium]